eukprot:TRINITY_DN6275_c0_g1_i4.p1 TRINITY_DN6275_c0_g1~~TRINITY_DN6275_c0_g1_i4.p1  ORF type:complete len:703 (-),score=124.45 TRINITY_DN6275_c0_g1_i4:164-2272(-)
MAVLITLALLSLHAAAYPHPAEECKADSCWGEGGLASSLVQLRHRVGTGGCKDTCYDGDGVIKLDKCHQARCSACSECFSGQSQASTSRPASGECKDTCYDSDGVIKLDKCHQERCSACSDCASPGSPVTTTRVPSSSSLRASSPSTSSIFNSSYNLLSGRPFVVDVARDAAEYCNFSLSSAPAGLSIGLRTGKLTWQPDQSQAGAYSVQVFGSCDGGGKHEQAILLEVVADGSSPQGIYVWLASTSEGDGSVGNPFSSLQAAIEAAVPGDFIYIRGGRYELNKTVECNIQASAEKPVTITRLPGERVHLLVNARQGFDVPEGAVGVTFSRLELDGRADKNDHWHVIKTSWWQVQDEVVGGDMGFQIDGEHVIVEDCVIHDLNQKGVNVYMGRYVTVRYNVIYNIGWASLSGGHGIMRKWDRNHGQDDPAYYRFDFYGNLLFAVEQRIYSFITTKAYCHMTIDEGKGILADESSDKEMKARIAHNLVLFGGVDHIRLKYNNNLEVLNNAVMPEEGRTDPVPDGITAVNSKKIPMVVKNNLVHSFPGSWPLDVSGHFTSDDYPDHLDQNYYSGGGDVRKELPGISDVSSVFRDPEALDFRASSTLPSGVGVDEAILMKVFETVEDYGVRVAATGWRHDHVKMVETIVNSAPAEHLSGPTIGDSKKEKGKQALWFDVISKTYKDICKCNKLELIPPEEYWEHQN